VSTFKIEPHFRLQEWVAEEKGYFRAEGLDYEICFGSGDKHRVSQVWDTQEHLDAFGAKLMPILADAGIDPGKPEMAEVHNIIKQ